MQGGVVTGGWPKLGDLVAQNKRVIVLWGKKLYYHIFRKAKKVDGFRNHHIWMQKYWAETYGSAYTSMYPNQFGNYLEHFCEDGKRFDKGQPMLLADAYLTISAKRGPFSICNKDLAGDVNPVLLDYKNMHTNPIVQMQSNCWKKQKQVSLLSMDYTMYFPYHLDRMARKLNERNFVEYGWVGGKMTVSGAQAKKTEADLKALIAKLGGVDPGRITVEKKDTVATARLLQGNRSRRMADLASGSATVHFSILAPAIHPLMDPSNTEVLAKVKEAAKAEAEVDSVSAVCRDPGLLASGARTPAALQESFDEGAELTFTCSPPKSAMHGTAKRVCGPDGLFDGIQPNCKEAWTKRVRLMPFWAKVLLVALLCLCILGCLGGCILLCVKKCMSSRYSKIQDES
uniref:Sushi domain-containing protein n=1 Tax=Alexandrium catenella TaxID=2925 RepID=A0A7S1QJD3_ALECA|mmetsp:Transcript_33385/g.90390  ORF Transcript_33385/g.90390 Transcript_33385/m.90390 type:complete len:400 (+) Transcript_33385:1-1200(+)